MSEIELHRKLLGDAVRNAALEAALKKLIVPGKTTVADLGAGTGYLSFLARKLGATHCTLVEYADTLDLAQKLARDNRVSSLAFVKAHSSEIRKPPKVDLVISETLGNFALEENLLETLVDARRFLKPGGRVLPCGLKQFVAPVVKPRLQEELDIWPGVAGGFDLSAARRVSLNNMYVKRVTPADLGAAALTRQWDELDFSPSAEAPTSLRRASLAWPAGALKAVHGFALWWEVELAPGVTLSTAPDAPATHWDQIYLPLLEPLAPARDESVELTLTSDTRPEVGVRLGWRTRLLAGGRAKRSQSQDTLDGRL